MKAANAHVKINLIRRSISKHLVNKARNFIKVEKCTDQIPKWVIQSNWF